MGECARAQTLLGILITMQRSRGVTELLELSGPFVSRGHSLNYNPEDKAPSGATEGHGGGGIVPHSMHPAFTNLQEMQSCGMS